MTDQFQFDTSGEVLMNRLANGRGEPWRDVEGGARLCYAWRHLSPGVRGCIAKILEEFTEARPWKIADDGFEPGFSDLHPDTLARIIADWERHSQRHALVGPWADIQIGRNFWSNRQNELSPNFPPLTFYLNDVGKVCIRECDQ